MHPTLLRNFLIILIDLSLAFCGFYFTLFTVDLGFYKNLPTLGATPWQSYWGVLNLVYGGLFLISFFIFKILMIVILIGFIISYAVEEFIIYKTQTNGAYKVNRILNENITVKILSGVVGPINESDISLAGASSALVLGFNVRAIPQAREQAKRDGLEIRYHSIIYELIEDVKQVLSGMLDPDLQEQFIGYAQIKQVFNITKIGKIAGCDVSEGVIRKGCNFRLLRESTVIHEGKLKTLQRFKDEVKEVKEGLECGMGLENFNDIKIGDIMECYEIKEIKKSLA